MDSENIHVSRIKKILTNSLYVTRHQPINNMPAVQTALNIQHDVMPFSGSPLHSFRHIPVCPTPVNIYKSIDCYEVFVFAPGRMKENFSIYVSGEELIIDYSPVHDSNSYPWVRQEYVRHGFERTFLLDDLLDIDGIEPIYEDGVLRFCVNIIKETQA